jgi:hypothetical protein
MHPNNNQCIKVTVGNNFLESKKEKKYYTLLKEKNISWEHIAKYHGTINTNKGEGLLFDIVKDNNGEISKTLSYYLQNETRTKSILNPIPLLEELKEYLLRENIMVKDFNTKNMMYQKLDNNKAKLIIVDGLEQTKIRSISRYIKYFSLKTINKRYNDFLFSLYRKYSHNKFFISLLKLS